MSPAIKALRIPADETRPVELCRIGRSLLALAEQVCDPFYPDRAACVPSGIDNMMIWYDTESSFARTPRNSRAERLNFPDWEPYGDVVLCGQARTGRPASISSSALYWCALRGVEPAGGVMNRNRQARLEDALWLLEQGESPEHTARRVGWALGTLAHALRKHGALDHARSCETALNRIKAEQGARRALH